MISALLIRGRRGIGEDKSRAGGGWPFGGEGERTVALLWPGGKARTATVLKALTRSAGGGPWNQRRPAASPLDLPPTAVAV